MKISRKTKIDDLLNRYPFLEKFLIRKSPKFKKLGNPVMRKTIGKIASLEKVAAMGGIDLDTLLAEITLEIMSHEGKNDNLPSLNAGQKQNILKGIILDLHKGKDILAVKKSFKELVRDVSPSEIANMEQKLIEEGLPEEEVKKLCDVHVAVFQDSLEEQPLPEVDEGHPVHTFMAENRVAEKLIGDINKLLSPMGDGLDQALFNKDNLNDLIIDLSNITTHYLRKENQLFPLLEAHEISGPSQVMWSIHDDIRVLLKKLRSLPMEPRTVSMVKEVITAIGDMVYKEEHILFPMALETLTESDWVKVRQGEGEIGYAWVPPPAGWGEEHELSDRSTGKLNLSMGQLTLEQINLMLTHLPVDITFVDENDRVGYYSQGKERIFPRSPAIIGRKVQKCHPSDSVHIVEQILKAFKAGEKDSAEFWLRIEGRFIHIRYFAMRSSNKYKGCLEVSHDITGIKEIEGEKRLLDWASKIKV